MSEKGRAKIPRRFLILKSGGEKRKKRKVNLKRKMDGRKREKVAKGRCTSKGDGLQLQSAH